MNINRMTNVAYDKIGRSETYNNVTGKKKVPGEENHKVNNSLLENFN